jgi:D-alanyl-D-alanine carboxypeptidase
MRGALTIWILAITLQLNAQPINKADLHHRLDSLLEVKADHPFNGQVLITHQGKTLYSKTQGYGNWTEKSKFPRHPQFVIGSVSKQIAAVLILRAQDQGRLDIHQPIGTYLPGLPMAWKDSVTTHHLLNHTSGIRDRTQPLATRPGTQFSYSGLGYALLGEILEAVYGQSFDVLAFALFGQSGMHRSTAPTLPRKKHCVKGYVRQEDGNNFVETGFPNGVPFPAGGLISTVEDICQWNTLLHGHQLLSDSTYLKMITPTSKRPHPIFGDVDYGYGIQITNIDSLHEISHGGYAPGYVTVNFYYPATQTSLVVMENLDWNDPAFKETFYYEMEIRKILREFLLTQPAN